MFTFEANSKKWSTDEQTMSLLKEFREAGNEEMLAATFELGVAFGKIVEA
jgi:hypothetical protein